MIYTFSHLGLGATDYMLCYFEGLSKWSNAERWKLIEVAQSLGGPPDELSAVIKIETAGTFSPSIKNPTSSASGLIQWIETTAQSVHGISTAQIRAMGVCEQLELARAYFQKVMPGGKWKQPGDFYVAVAGGPYPAGSPGANANPGWDTNKDGAVSLQEIRNLAIGVKNAACANGKKISVTPEACAGGGSVFSGNSAKLFGVAAFGAGVWYAARQGWFR